MSATIADLTEYRELVDRGERASVVMLHDGLGADPTLADPPPLTPKEKNLIAGELQGMRVGGIAAANLADRPSSRHLHKRILDVVNELDRITSDLRKSVGHDTREDGDSGDSSVSSGVVSGDAGDGPTLPRKLGASPPVGTDAVAGKPVTRNEGDNAA